MSPSTPSAGAEVMALIDALARFSDEPGRLTRLYLSAAHRDAARMLRDRMAEAGLAARIDAAGSVIGRLEGREPGLPALILGSHIDTVVDAGRFDGPLGVACALVATRHLAAEAASLPFALEVVAFGDEENVRFPTTLSTAAALAGRYDPAWLDGRDREGVSLRDALLAFGGDPDGIAALARHPRDVRGYIEVHIEQGPVLEASDLALGVVTAINGNTRARLAITGEAGHAGTVPMGLRRDPLAAAAEIVGIVERIGGRRDDTVATVGALQVRPGAVNVIPARVDLTLDARAPDDAVRAAMVTDMLAEFHAVADRRGVDLAVEPFMDSPATAMDPLLTEALAEGAGRAGFPTLRLPSGAGHDAVAMARLCPAAMLFVRCRGGVSHNPAESITEDDADAAARALIETVRVLATRS